MQRILVLIAVLLASGCSQATFAADAAPIEPTLQAATQTLVTEFKQQVSCGFGSSTKVGIWPLDADKLPMAPQSAEQLYGAVLADLIASKPDCVRFLDGAGAGATLDYLNKTGALRLQGSTSRDQINAAFRDVEYIVSMSIHDQGGTIVAALKLANKTGETVAATPTFIVPTAYLDRGCGVGAVPFDTAVVRAAKTLSEAAPDMHRLVNGGGFFADTTEQTSFAGYAGQRFVDELLRAYANTITGRQLLIAEENQPGETGTYRLQFRFWPCSGDDRLVLSAQLTGSDGAAASWSGAVLVASLPKGIAIAPAPDAPEMWSLSVTPSRASVGGELVLAAEVPDRCNPVFVDFAPSGKAAVIPQQFFMVEKLDDGGRSYRVDASTRYGLTILPEDEKGMHNLGYFCRAENEETSVNVLRTVWLEMAASSGRQIRDKEKRSFWFERYEVR